MVNVKLICTNDELGLFNFDIRWQVIQSLKV